MESLYLGKYFVGNLMTTPIYVSGNATKPFIYMQESALFADDATGHAITRGMVTRALINANVMTELLEPDLLKNYSLVKDKANC